MILKDFFAYYFEVADPEVLKIYQGLLPGSTDLAADYEKMFSRNDEEAIAFLLRFHKATNELKRNRPEQAILFNVHGNVCFPFFVEYIWKVMDDSDRTKVLQEAGCDNLKDLTRALDERVELRNWFRREIGSSLSQEDLFIMNEIIALQNFSSGGEFSFLKYAYPTIKQTRGRVLDAGCGAGFASLVMSQHVTVYAVDACQARLERGMALYHMMKKGEKEIFPQVINLIEEELGEIAVQCEFPSAETLLSEPGREITFVEGSIDTLSYEDQFFDAINCLDVLEHTFAPEKIIKEFARVLKPGGKVFITAPTRYGEVEQRIHESIEGTMFPAMLHMHHFDPQTLSSLFAANGFKEEEMLPFDYMSWEEFLEIAAKSPARELAEELKNNPFDKVALQLYAVYEKE